MENYPLIWKKLTYLHYMYNNYCTCENLKFNKSYCLKKKVIASQHKWEDTYKHRKSAPSNTK